MSIFSNLFSKIEKPVVTSTTEGISFSYATDTSLFYKIYEENAYVEMCVRRLADDMGKYGYTVKRGKFEKDNSLFSNLTGYSFGMTENEFFKRIVRDYEVAGNVYVYIARSKTGKVEGLQILDPRYMKPICDSSGQILGYIQNFNGIRGFTRDEVFHLRYDSDLTNEAIGRSKIQSLFIDLETDKEAKESNWAFFKNNQTPASIVVLNDDYQSESVAVMAEIKKLFQGGSNSTGKNKHRTAIIQGVKEVIKLQDKIEDGQFLNLRGATLELTCAKFGVPKDILGFTDTSNRSVGEAQAENYWDTIEGLENDIAQYLSKILVAIYGEGYSIEFYQDNTRKLSSRGKIANDLYNGGIITLNESREIVNYEKVTDGDKFATKTVPAVK